MIETTNLTVSENLSMSTSKWFNSLFFAFCRTIEHLSRTAPMLLRYPAGSTCGSGDLGRATLGIVGGIDILEKPGVAGDFSDDCEENEPRSLRLAEFLRELESASDEVFFLREKRPMLATQGKWDWNVAVRACAFLATRVIVITVS